MALSKWICCFALAGMSALAVGADKPNVVFFLADDLGWRDLGAWGSDFYETPNADRLARESMRFTAGYAACPVCSPTRASIQSGKYPARLATTDYFGAAQPENWQRNTRLLPAAYEEELPLGETTIAEAFKEGGYATFFAGKWHLGPERSWPENQGYEINKGGCQAGAPLAPGRYFSPYGNPRLPDGPPGEHLPDRLASEAVGFIESVKDRPFFAFLSFYSVHTPLMTRADLKGKYEEKAKALRPEGPAWLPEGSRQARQIQDHAVYAGMVEAMDGAMGKVLGAIDRLGLADKTVVCFMSDNGGLSTSEGSPTSNVPLRAGKGWLYEGGIREPMMIKWPGVARAGAVSEHPVTSTDFYPTLLEIAGLPARPEQHLDGVSLVPLLKGSGVPGRDAIFWHYPHYGNQGGAPGGAIRAGEWKLIEWYEDGKLELFHIKDDIGEKRDMAAEQPQRVRDLAARLRAWREKIGARMPSPNPAYDAHGPDGRSTWRPPQKKAKTKAGH